MENVEQTPTPITENPRPHRHRPNWLPLVLVLVGVSLLLTQLGVILPFWLTSWQMLLIVIGVLIGLSSGFRDPKWMILILVGGVFLIEDIIPGFNFHRFLWPVVIIVAGLFMFIRPKNFRADRWGRRGRRNDEYQRNLDRGPQFGSSNSSYTSETYLETNTFFGGVSRTVVTKDFKGGEINVFMGGTEINLSQADIIGSAKLEINQCMGGTKLIVPTHWEIRSELNTVFGNVEDKRQQPIVTNPDKVLIIEGNSVFGGIEIRNF